MSNELDAILNPRTIAIVGASNDPEKRGYRAIKTLLADEYRGTIVPINPKEKKILELDCYARLQDAPHDIDLAIICTPARTTPEMVRQCGEKGVKGALLLAGGSCSCSRPGSASALPRRRGLWWRRLASGTVLNYLFPRLHRHFLRRSPVPPQRRGFARLNQAAPSYCARAYHAASPRRHARSWLRLQTHNPLIFLAGIAPVSSK